MKKMTDKKKQNGEVFTPIHLANFLAERMVKYLDVKATLRLCDPSCGDGALLYALIKISTEKQNGTLSVFGSDKDANYLANAEQLLTSSFPQIQMNFEEKDFVAERVNSLFGSAQRYDAIIGNPPYVRTQTLGNEMAQAISKLYELSGRVDLYYPFIINMTDSLDEGGILAVITSNRYLTTKSGEPIRKYLLDNYDILEIIDLGDTKLFDAAVLPAIFIGRKNSQSNKNDVGTFLKIYENISESIECNPKSDVFEVLNSGISGNYNVGDTCYKYSHGKFVRPIITTDVWQMNTDEEQLFIDTVQSNTNFYVGDRFKVRVGVKSCADEVFLNQENYESDERPEDVFFRNMISQENITPWTISESLFHAIYPHFDNKGKKDVLDIESYPKAKAFFIKHEERLKKRTYLMKSNRKWYEYWVPQNATLWSNTKLVFPDISVEPRFAIDTTGAIVNGNCYWLYADNEEDVNLLYLIEGIANSNLMVKYHDLCFNNKLYSGRRRYLTQYVERYPIPDPNSNYSRRIIELARLLHCQSSDFEYNNIITELNDNVERAFNITQG